MSRIFLETLSGKEFSDAAAYPTFWDEFVFYLTQWFTANPKDNQLVIKRLDLVASLDKRPIGRRTKIAQRICGLLDKNPALGFHQNDVFTFNRAIIEQSFQQHLSQTDRGYYERLATSAG